MSSSLAGVPTVEMPVSPLPGFEGAALTNSDDIEPPSTGGLAFTQKGRRSPKDGEPPPSKLAPPKLADEALAGKIQADHRPEWKKMIQDRGEKDDMFYSRLRAGQPSASDVALVAEALARSGEEAITLDVFASHLRLVDKEFLPLIDRFPEIARAVEMGRAARKEALTGIMLQAANRSGTAAQALVQGQLAEDPLTEREKREKEKGSAEKVASRLAAMKVPKPKSYLTCHVIMGDSGTPNEHPDTAALLKPAGWMSPAEVWELMEKKPVPVNLPIMPAPV